MERFHAVQRFQSATRRPLTTELHRGVLAGFAAMDWLDGINPGQDTSCPIKKNTFTVIAKPSANIVGVSTVSFAPQLGAMIPIAGSTNSGEVIAKADNVHTLAAVVGQRWTFIRRSARMSKG